MKDKICNCNGSRFICASEMYPEQTKKQKTNNADKIINGLVNINQVYSIEVGNDDDDDYDPKYYITFGVGDDTVTWYYTLEIMRDRDFLKLKELLVKDDIS